MFANNTEFDNASAESIHRNKPKPVNGQRTRYLAQVIDIEEKNGYKGYSFLIHFRIVEGPTDVGMKFAFVSQPQKVKPEVQKLEYAKIKRAVGAVFGLSDKEAGSVTGLMIQKALKANGKPSPMRGRLVEIEAYPVLTKKAKEAGKTEPDSSGWDPYPHLVNGQPVDRSIDSSVQASNDDEPESPAAAAPESSPPPPPAANEPPPPPAVDHMARALAEGWKPHPSSPGCFYKGQVSKWEKDLKAGAF